MLGFLIIGGVGGWAIWDGLDRVFHQSYPWFDIFICGIALFTIAVIILLAGLGILT